MIPGKTRPPALEFDLSGYEVLVAVCGGIAAYKVCQVVSELTQRGAGVTVAMTRAARKFVGPLSFQALSGRSVLTNPWALSDQSDIQHIRRTEAADAVLIAPATANIIAKIAVGIADDLVSTLATTVTAPLLLAPAMNDRMWANPVVQRNVATLVSLGHILIGPAEGWLACRSVGPGRMVEPREIIDAVVGHLKSAPRNSAPEPRASARAKAPKSADASYRGAANEPPA